MENASKALLIAAGILFAMLVLTMMVYMSGRITEMGEAQESKRAAEQLAAFNAEYEAYNKKLMYGTDVITVVNKAIEYNGGLDVDEKEDFIDVKIILEQNFIGVMVKLNESSEKETTRGEYIADQETLGEGTYNLRQDTSSIKMNEDIIKFLSSVSDSRVEGEGKDAIWYYDGITDFKRAIFQCNDMLDTNGDGKIDYIELEQKNLATY